MNENIEAILFDMGGTLRRTTERDEADKKEAILKIMELVGADLSLDEFTEMLFARARAYKQWAEDTRIELSEKDLWTRWMLPDWPAEKISPLAITLNQLNRAAIGTRAVFPEAREVTLELFRRGYRLGLVSNTTSSVEVPATLRELGVIGCFETIILSTVVGLRKPDPAILLDATRRMGVKPERCVYIGDRPNRDVISSKQAGFAKTIILHDPQKPYIQPEHPDLTPDWVITNLKGLLDLFPARSAAHQAKTEREIPLYDAALSTMWAKKNFPTLNDFFLMARRLGFAKIELNHQINSAMLAGIDLAAYKISSIHEPCPADISMDTLKQKDWLVSAVDEENRRQGVEAIKRSIDLARQLSVPVIVVHSGTVPMDMKTEYRMRTLYDAGLSQSDEFLQLKTDLERDRAALAGPRLKAVIKSLNELLEYAAPHHIQLGLENRYHYVDIPLFDELEQLLALAEPDRLGFIYDVGHAQALDGLGFYPYEAWLKKYSNRIVGTHLHDVKGVTDHFAPGLGRIDFDNIAQYLPDGAFRTCELVPANSAEQVKDGLKILAEHGCVRPLENR